MRLALAIILTLLAGYLVANYAGPIANALGLFGERPLYIPVPAIIVNLALPGLYALLLLASGAVLLRDHLLVGRSTHAH